MGQMFFGENPVLEAEADRLIKESMKGQTAHSAKSDVLTPWKLADRYGREVYTSSGTPDPALRRGMFGRVASSLHPHLNSRLGVAPPTRAGQRVDSLSDHVSKNGSRIV